MFILNQNKTSLCDLNGRNVFCSDSNPTYLGMADMVRADPDDIFHCGIFETKERAQEVLADISRALIEGCRVFEIPER